MFQNAFSGKCHAETQEVLFCFVDRGLFGDRSFCALLEEIIVVVKLDKYVHSDICCSSFAVRNRISFSIFDKQRRTIYPKQKKKASPEECDQAVEDLSSAKAKEKAKKLQETKKGVSYVLKRVWAMILGIGPALRRLLRMSRADWAIKMRQWKQNMSVTFG